MSFEQCDAMYSSNVHNIFPDNLQNSKAAKQKFLQSLSIRCRNFGSQVQVHV